MKICWITDTDYNTTVSAQLFPGDCASKTVPSPQCFPGFHLDPCATLPQSESWSPSCQWSILLLFVIWFSPPSSSKSMPPIVNRWLTGLKNIKDGRICEWDQSSCCVWAHSSPGFLTFSTSTRGLFPSEQNCTGITSFLYKTEV